MDLSPGMRISPERALERRAVAGFGSAGLDMDGVNRNKIWWLVSSGEVGHLLTQLGNAVILQMQFQFNPPDTLFSFDKRSELRLWDHEFFLMSGSRKG